MSLYDGPEPPEDDGTRDYEDDRASDHIAEQEADDE